MEQTGIEELKKAGKITQEVKSFAKSFIIKGMLLLEIADKIESKIRELGGKPAFPVNLSINEIAAHSTPAWNDSGIAHGLLKVDIGVHIDGFVADTAISIDLENNLENKKLIEAAEQALINALQHARLNAPLNDIGKSIEQTIKSFSFLPVQNLSGHSIEPWNLHAGITVPNFGNGQNKVLEEGVYAIEPFSTNGFGAVRDGRKSGIFSVQKEANVRDSFAREVFAFIQKEYQTLPFCSRWLHKKFGSRALLALQRLEEAGILHHYAQLVEINKGKVAQAEHTIIVTEKETIVTT
ncbi:type II methionyl aminopeptidase [Candidatus Pacearchaeota archaeon]|nr:type II methionyl aminopeptidase [Candidatus Pacearchaeota archaeon]